MCAACLQVGARGVAAFGVLVIIEGQAHFLHPRGELARVLRADAVVLGRGEDERLGIGARPLRGSGRARSSPRRRGSPGPCRRCHIRLPTTRRRRSSRCGSCRAAALRSATAFHSSGCWVNSTPISRPPLEPPWMPSRRGLVILRRDQVLRDRGEIVVDDLPLGRRARPRATPARTRRRRGCWRAHRRRLARATACRWSPNRSASRLTWKPP